MRIEDAFTLPRRFCANMLDICIDTANRRGRRFILCIQ